MSRWRTTRRAPRRLVAGRYDLRSEQARDAQGILWRGVDTLLRRDVVRMPARELGKRMTRATDAVFTRAEKDQTSLREAAFDIAVERVARAAEIRGYV